jgi:hypothetical protein
MNSGRQLQCAEHGPALAAFVCRHVVEQPGQRWFSGYPRKGHPYPDAWCGDCDAHRQAAGGQWDAASEAAADIQLVCGQCYDAKRAESLHALEASVDQQWPPFCDEQVQALKAQQNRLHEVHHIGQYQRYDYDLPTKRLWFSTGGTARLQADIEVAGTFSHACRTWMWSWANFSLPAKVRTRMKRVRTLGEERGFARLTHWTWPADEVDAWAMTAIAAQLLKAEGAYKSPGKDADVYFTLSRLRPVLVTA